MRYPAHFSQQERTHYKEAVKALSPTRSTAIAKKKELTQNKELASQILDSSLDLQAKLPDSFQNRGHYTLVHAVLREEIITLTTQIKRFHTMAYPPKPSNNHNDLTPAQINQLKEDNPIENFIQTPIQTSSRYRLKTLCPFHAESTPSFTIYTDQNTFHCYGCSAHGDVIDLIQHIHQVDFPTALKYLQPSLPTIPTI